MPNKSSPIPYISKATLTAIVAFLSYLFYKVSEPAWTATQLPASDQPIQFYSNQTNDDLTSIFVNAIKSSKRSITMVIFALLDPHVIQALRTQSDAGVEVFIVCDAKASPGITQKLPKAEIVRRAGKGLTHEKILVIDEKQIWIGSANMTTDSLRVHGNLVIGLENPSLAQALAEKLKSMDDQGKSSIDFNHKQTVVGGQNVELWVLPDDQTAAKRMIELFQSAKKTIKVAMFTWTRIDFTQELIAAARRGVQVEAVLDRYSGKGASAKIVRMLMEAHISVRLSTGKGLLHHKFAYIDDEILINGSANWTTSAFKVNDDCFIVIYPLTPEQQAKMNQLWRVIQAESADPNAPLPSKPKPKRERKRVPVEAY